MSLFETTGPKIFEDPNALRPTYQPQYFVELDERVEECIHYLQPILQGQPAHNLIIKGGPGTGKTTTVRYLLSELDEEVTDSPGVDLTSIFVPVAQNCTDYQALIEIVNRLRERRDGSSLSKTGHARDDILSKLSDELRRLRGSVVIVIDDCHLITDPNPLFNDLSRIADRNDINDISVRTIAIANDASFQEKLQADTMSTLSPVSIDFGGFSVDELSEILQVRADQAFCDDVNPNKAIPRCAAIGVKNGGDARYALELMKEAGNQALSRVRNSDPPQSEQTLITHDDVTRAQSTYESNWYVRAAEGLNGWQEQILIVMIDLACHGRTPCRIDMVRKRLSYLTKEEISNRQVRKCLHALKTQELVAFHSQNDGCNGGQWYEVELSVELTEAFGALRAIDSFWLDDQFIQALFDEAVSNDLLFEDQRNKLLAS